MKRRYDGNFLVDYIDKRIHVFSKVGYIAEVREILLNSTSVTMLESHYKTGAKFILNFTDTDIDDFIKIAERLHNEYRRICGYEYSICK